MKKLIDEIIEFGNDMNRHNAPAFASSVAFFFFLALFPSMMFLCSLIQYLPVSELELLDFILNLCPAGLSDTISKIVGDIYTTSASLVPITAIATLWTAGMGIMGLIRGLNGLLEIEDDRNYFVIRGIATLYTILLFAALLITLILLGWGQVIYHHVVAYFPEARKVMKMILHLRFVFSITVLIVLFDLVYTFLPAKRQRLSYQLPGALISAVGWVVVTRFFGIYIDYFNGFSIYGSMLTIIVILFWFYTCFTILIFGAFFNKYYNKQVKSGLRGIQEKRRIHKQDRILKKSIKNAKNIDNN